MGPIATDVRNAVRNLRKQPAFVALAALTLALGTGGATTIFSVIQNLLLDPLPYAKPDSILVFQIRDPASPVRGDRAFFQLRELLAYQRQVSGFEEVIAIDGGRDVLYATQEGTEHFIGAAVSGNTFHFLGVSAATGRILTPDDAEPDAEPVFVMSHRLWTDRFGRDPAILGRRFVLNGRPTTLVGIMPPRFAMLGVDLWQPVALDRANPATTDRFYHLHMRLKPGVTRQQAEAEFHTVAQRLAESHPRLYPKPFTVKALSIVEASVGPIETTLYTFAAAAALLLLIGCGNVANMLLAKATVREKEMAIRASLGASRPMLIRLLLIESLLLAVLGAGLGALFADFGLKALVALIPSGLIPAEIEIRMNLPVWLFSLAVAAVTAFVFGLFPALRTARRDVAVLLNAPGTAVNASLHRTRFSDALVVAEVALSVVLLSGAGLLMRTFINLQAIELGVNPQNVLFVRLRLPAGEYGTAGAKQQLLNQLLPRVEALPGVIAVGASSAVPLDGGIRSGIGVPGRPTDATLTTLVQLCTEGYFRTTELRLLRGRLLSQDDVRTGRRVAVVNDTLARRYFGEPNPVGRRITLTFLETQSSGAADNPPFEIVGVVADSKNHGIRNPSLPESFIPSSVTGAYGRSILVRTAANPFRVLNSVRREIWSVDRNLVLAETGNVIEILRKFSYAEPRFALVVLSVFAGLALGLVALGVYGVIAYTVSRQTHEIGIRLALGALPRDVQRMVLLTALRLIALGVVIGVMLALGGTRILANHLWGVRPSDPLTLGAAVGLVVAVGVLACYGPVRRATRVEPLISLRHTAE